MSDKRHNDVLIVTNSRIEFDYIQQTFPDVKSLDDRRVEFNFNSHTCIILRSDPGVFSLSYYLTKELSGKKYGLVINAGICGSYTNTVDIGDAIRIKRDVFADTGAEDGKTLFEIGLIGKDDFPFKKGELFDSPGNIAGLDEILPSGKAVTVNRISQSYGNISFIRTKYRPDIESMEGAAFFYVCSHEKVNFLQIRSVSNFVGEKNKEYWEIEKAMNSLGDALKKILNAL